MFNNIKKLGAILLCISIIIVGCSKNEVSNISIQDNDVKKFNIVTTTFPVYDITKELVKGIDNIKLSMLIDSGVDLHNYSPTSKDMMELSNCDMFIYIGGESDEWVDESFETLGIDEEKKVNLMENLKSYIKEEEAKEGMEEEEEENEEEVEYDEHIWLSLKNVNKICEAIYEKLDKKLSDEDKGTLSSNYYSYCNKITVLNERFTLLIENAKNDNKSTTLLFADRFPFRYFVDDYGLDYYAAFKGCSAESEASFKTVKYLADKVNELELKYIFIIEDNDKKIADTVIETAGKDNVSILIMDSMQNKTIKDVENGLTYLDVMKSNYDVLDKFFNN